MKKLIIALVFGMSLTGFAQETQKPNRSDMEKMTPEQRQQKHLARLTHELTLDAKQQGEVNQILTEKSAKSQEFKKQREARIASGQKMTAEEKTAFKNTMQAEKTDTDNKMKAVLSPTQYQKWQENNEKNRDKMKDKINEQKE